MSLSSPASISFKRARREAAQGLVEYSLIIALVALLAIGGLAAFGSATGGDVTSLLSGLSASV